VSEAQRSALLALIARRTSEDEARLDTAGVPWAVVALENEYGYAAVYGPIADPVEACALAERLTRELREEFEQGTWTVRVARLSPAGDVP
jgi:hypothetical protein